MSYFGTKIKIGIKTFIFLGIILSLNFAVSVIAQPPGPPPEHKRKHPPRHESQRGNKRSMPTNEKPFVKITVEGNYRIITSNGIPQHKTGRFPNRHNPNAISAHKQSFRMPIRPEEQSKNQTQADRYLFGVALNGVVFDPGTAEIWAGKGQELTRMRPGIDRSKIWNYEALNSSKINLGVDRSHAHVQPTGAYHYHGMPVGLIERLRKQNEKKMIQVGWAADGFPIYAIYGHAEAKNGKSKLVVLKSSYQLKKGKRPRGSKGPGGTYDGTFTQDFEYQPNSGDLDEFNGREGVTPEFPQGTYYYMITKEFPYIPRFFKGNPDESFRKKMDRRPRRY